MSSRRRGRRPGARTDAPGSFNAADQQSVRARMWREALRGFAPRASKNVTSFHVEGIGAFSIHHRDGVTELWSVFPRHERVLTFGVARDAEEIAASAAELMRAFRDGSDRLGVFFAIPRGAAMSADACRAVDTPRDITAIANINRRCG